MARRLYIDFNTAYSKIRTYSTLTSATRFYAHTPTCWMVVVDDVIFFQPYTFGESKEHRKNQENRCLGSYMPVLKFKANTNTSEILENHFVKLWDTSDNDMFHVEAQLEDKKYIINKIFRQRLRWLKSVAGILSMHENNTDGSFKDRRKSTRQRCKSGQPFKVSWDESGRIKKATIKDFSGDGICLELADDSTIIKPNQILKLMVTPNPTASSSNFIIQQLFKNNKNEFIVMGVDAHSPVVIRLQAKKASEKSRASTASEPPQLQSQDSGL